MQRTGILQTDGQNYDNIHDACMPTMSGDKQQLSICCDERPGRITSKMHIHAYKASRY